MKKFKRLPEQYYLKTELKYNSGLSVVVLELKIVDLLRVMKRLEVSYPFLYVRFVNFIRKINEQYDNNKDKINVDFALPRRSGWEDVI